MLSHLSQYHAMCVIDLMCKIAEILHDACNHDIAIMKT